MRATFFVTQIYSLSNSKIELLQNFQNKGHEIGCHGWKHINAEEYLCDHSIEEYLNSEIYPSLELMEKHNIQIKSYSYPYGYNCDSLDNIMLEIFLGLRDVTEEQRKPLEKNIDEINEIFFPYENKKLVAGLGIDKNFNISMNMIEDGFRRASEQNEVIVFYAHKPVIKATAPYQIEHEYLKEMFNLAKKYGLKSYTFSELYE